MLSEAHRRQRIGRITSSIIPAIVGADPFSSPYDALIKIRGEDTFEGNAATRRGNVFEPALLQWMAEETGMKFAEAPFQAHQNGWSGDSADGLLLDGGRGTMHAVLEAKTVAGPSIHLWGEPQTDDVPEKVFVQAHWHLLHWPDAPICLVPVVFGGNRFETHCYAIARDQEYEAYLFETAEAWHRRHVQGDEPVPLGPGDADRLALLQKQPRDWEDALACDEKLLALIKRHIDADKAAKAADKTLAQVKNELRAAIGEHSGIDAAADGYCVTYRKNKEGTRTDWHALAAELRPSEEMILRHTKVEAGARVLKVAKKTTRKIPQGGNVHDN